MAYRKREGRIAGPALSRRTAVRNTDRAGVPRQIAKAIIVHKTAAVYNRYRIVNEQNIHEGVACAQQFMKSGQPCGWRFRPSHKSLILRLGGVSVLVCRLDFKSSDRG